jgi:hypothetical protein
VTPALAALGALLCLACHRRSVRAHDDAATDPFPSRREVHGEGLWLALAGGLALLAAGLAVT